MARLRWPIVLPLTYTSCGWKVADTTKNLLNFCSQTKNLNEMVFHSSSFRSIVSVHWLPCDFFYFMWSCFSIISLVIITQLAAVLNSFHGYVSQSICCMDSVDWWWRHVNLRQRLSIHLNFYSWLEHRERSLARYRNLW